MSYRKKHSPPKPEQQTLFPSAEVEYSNPGTIRTLSTAKLTSGLPYQRPVEQKNVDKLVRNWNNQDLYSVVCLDELLDSISEEQTGQELIAGYIPCGARYSAGAAAMPCHGWRGKAPPFSAGTPKSTMPPPVMGW